MNLSKQKNITLFSIFGIAYWFFGNLYEAIVFGPNWSLKDPNHLKHLNDFFVNSSPTAYFVPMTLITAISVWILLFTNKIENVKREYRIASILTLVITAMTSLIVAFVLSKMFGPGYFENPANGSFYGQLWNVLNAFRLVLEIATIYYLFSAYRKLDKINITTIS